MKKIFNLLLITIISFVLLGCSKESFQNTDKEWSVEFFVSYNKFDRTSTLDLILGGSGTVSIDWGDGRVFNNINLKEIKLIDGDLTLNYIGGNEFNYYYENEGSYKVKINGIGKIDAIGVEFISSDDSNQTTNFDAKNIDDLAMLSLYNVNSLNYNINKLVNLIYLRVEQCSLQNITTNNFPGLVSLNCAGNYLTSLNLQDNAKLKYLECYSNKLSLLNISNCINIKYISCMYNSLPAAEMTQLYYQLPVIKSGSGYLEVDKKTSGDINIAKEKGWTIREF